MHVNAAAWRSSIFAKSLNFKALRAPQDSHWNPKMLGFWQADLHFFLRFVSTMCLCVCAYVCECLQKPEEGIRPLAEIVMSSVSHLTMAAGNCSQVFSKSSKCSQSLSAFSAHPHYSFLSSTFHTRRESYLDTSYVNRHVTYYWEYFIIVIINTFQLHALMGCPIMFPPMPIDSTLNSKFQA